MSNNNLADISAFESLQSEQHNRTNMSSMSVFNEFTRKSDESLVESIAARLEYLKKKGKSKSQEQADYDRELAWTEGVYKAAQKRLEDNDYE
jgi:chorismate mutase